ncbi:unnamed protein product [Acanthoscelides obtectus]|uniref:Uncharacterized protein n=1 Tax=Acanthoscelides obtectus TaxID=200917 RepID=A0A9P0PB13_ACAOB|nr:unnamed protein product [Acanthoscelides obtectus]CAK1640022.1 hypothetical protein AOBTE_LOCUS11512 [Acanthoscelides obtectus]
MITNVQNHNRRILKKQHPMNREPVMDNEPRASVFNKEPKKPSTPRNAFTAIENVSLVTEAPAEPVLKKMVASSKFLHRYRLAAMNRPQSK